MSAPKSPESKVILRLKKLSPKGNYTYIKCVSYDSNLGQWKVEYTEDIQMAQDYTLSRATSINEILEISGERLDWLSAYPWEW